MKSLTTDEEKDYKMLDINIKVGLAFTLVTLAIILVVYLLYK
jgi:hypothetical protein